MTARYLLGRAGAFPLAIPADRMLRIWPASAKTPDTFAYADTMDLRRLLGSETEGEGVAIAIETSIATVLIVDKIGTFASFADDDFIALPAVFEFALQFLDAACRRPVDGIYPLRLRLSPRAD